MPQWFCGYRNSTIFKKLPVQFHSPQFIISLHSLLVLLCCALEKQMTFALEEIVSV
jgi:hypothetical protein